jgi:hypothetical protein
MSYTNFPSARHSEVPNKLLLADDLHLSKSRDEVLIIFRNIASGWPKKLHTKLDHINFIKLQYGDALLN